MRRLLVLVVMAGATVFLAPPANACLCGRDEGTRAELMRDAEVVFVGEVRKALPGPYWEADVLAVAKGRVPARVALRDRSEAMSCFNSAIEGWWRNDRGAFVYVGPADLYVAPCSSRLWAEPAEVIREFGLVTYPPEPLADDDRSGAIGLALAGVAAVLAGIRWVTSRRIAAASAGGRASAG